MLWVIERGLFFANEQQRFVDALRDRHAKVRLVDYVPIAHALDPEIKPNGEVAIAFGSTNMIRAVKKLGWTPGVWHNETFRFEVWKSLLGDELLNADGQTMTFGALEFTGSKFVRPSEDLKAFSGAVVTAARMSEWKESVLRYVQMADEPDLVTDATLVVVAEPKAILAEYRFFVVRKVVVSGCQYQPHMANATDRAWVYAQEIANRWQPAVGFVLDVAETPTGFKVIEYNCLNSAGLYDCYVPRIVESIETALTEMGDHV